jgi:hypothetical protein
MPRDKTIAVPVPVNGIVPALLVSAIAFLVYLRTLSPGMQLGDGTELGACAYVLGVPHPTGYPLYMLIAKLWLLLTVQGEVIVRTTLLNAVLMAASAGLATRIAQDVLRSIFANWSQKSILLAAASAGLATALLRFHWENAVVTEVYALEFLLMLVFVRVLQRTTTPRRIALAALIVGLGLAHHRMSVFLLLPLVIAGWQTYRTAPAHRARWVAAAGALLLLPLLLYAYMPLRAARAPLHWGNTRTVSGFVEHVRGSEYLARSFMRPGQGRHFTPDTYVTFAGRELVQIAGDFVGQLTATPEKYYFDRYVERLFLSLSWRHALLLLVLGPLAIYGAVRWKRADARSFWITAGVTAQNLLVLFIYNILDIRDYYLFPLWFGWMCTWCGLLGAVEFLARRRRIAHPMAAYACLLAPAIIGVGNFRRCDESGNDAAEVLSETILPNLPAGSSAESATLPPNSILLTGSDYDTFTCWYRQHVRHERTDVLVFASNFIWKPWYPMYFPEAQKQRYKLVFAGRVAQDVAEYVDQLSRGVIDANLPVTPVYTSISDPAALQELGRRYNVQQVKQSWISQDKNAAGAVAVTLYRITPRS